MDILRDWGQPVWYCIPGNLNRVNARWQRFYTAWYPTFTARRAALPRSSQRPVRSCFQARLVSQPRQGSSRGENPAIAARLPQLRPRSGAGPPATAGHVMAQAVLRSHHHRNHRHSPCQGSGSRLRATSSPQGATQLIPASRRPVCKTRPRRNTRSSDCRQLDRASGTKRCNSHLVRPPESSSDRIRDAHHLNN